MLPLTDGVRTLKPQDASVKQHITGSDQRMKQDNTIDPKVETFQVLLKSRAQDKEVDSY